MTRTASVPLLLVILLFGLVGPSPLFGLAFAAVLLPSLVVRRRAEATPLGETLLCLVVAFAVGVVISAVVPRVVPNGTLKVGWAVLAGAGLAAAVVRFWLASPRGGVGVTLGIGLLSLAFCGGVQSGLLFPSFVVLFFLSSAWALRQADTARAPWSAWRRYVGATLVMLLFGALVGGGWALSLPPMHDWVLMKIMQRQYTSVGFSDRLNLGALEGLFESKKVVLRVRGPAVDHLRGIVYSHYYLGRWTQVQADRTVTTPFPTSRPADAIEIEMADSDSSYYFLPLGARDVALLSGVALVDRSQVLGPLAANPSDRLWFHWQEGNGSEASRPDSGDLELTWRVMRVLQPIAREWTAGARNHEEALAMLQRRLKKEARYSLHVVPRLGVDPIVDFVVRGKEGHCEYFASALAVMARTLGIPTRLVGGYRVQEHNPWGDYWVVRERDAHAWVEAWVPGRGWRQYDPTPADPAALAGRNSTPTLAGAFDALASGWSRFQAWLGQRSWLEVLTPLLLLVVLFFAQRWWRLRREAVAKHSGASPGFAELSAALEGVGVGRRSDETLHDYAQRLSGVLPGELSAAVAAALRRYGALRYGGRGEYGAVEEQLRLLVRDVRARRPL